MSDLCMFGDILKEREMAIETSSWRSLLCVALSVLYNSEMAKTITITMIKGIATYNIKQTLIAVGDIICSTHRLENGWAALGRMRLGLT